LARQQVLRLSKIWSFFYEYLHEWRHFLSRFSTKAKGEDVSWAKYTVPAATVSSSQPADVIGGGGAADGTISTLERESTAHGGTRSRSLTLPPPATASSATAAKVKFACSAEASAV
jgi:hypothetical protein